MTDGRYLEGLRVLVTRPRGQAEQTAATIAAAGGQALVHPCLELGPPADPAALDRALAGRHDLLVFTSANAVNALAARLRGPDARTGHALVAAVGERTAAALADLGVRVDVQAESASAEGLFRALRERLGAGLAQRSVLFPRAREGREELAQLLRQAGARVELVTAYEMVPARREDLAGAVSALREGAVDLVPLGSPRTAEVLLGALRPDAAAVLGRTIVGTIGERTAQTLARAGVAVDVDAGARPATFEALLFRLAEAARKR